MKCPNCGSNGIIAEESFPIGFRVVVFLFFLLFMTPKAIWVIKKDTISGIIMFLLLIGAFTLVFKAPSKTKYYCKNCKSTYNSIDELK